MLRTVPLLQLLPAAVVVVIWRQCGSGVAFEVLVAVSPDLQGDPRVSGDGCGVGLMAVSGDLGVATVPSPLDGHVCGGDHGGLEVVLTGLGMVVGLDPLDDLSVPCMSLESQWPVGVAGLRSNQRVVPCLKQRRTDPVRQSCPMSNSNIDRSLKSSQFCKRLTIPLFSGSPWLNPRAYWEGI